MSFQCPKNYSNTELEQERQRLEEFLEKTKKHRRVLRSNREAATHKLRAIWREMGNRGI